MAKSDPMPRIAAFAPLIDGGPSAEGTLRADLADASDNNSSSCHLLRRTLTFAGLGLRV